MEILDSLISSDPLLSSLMRDEAQAKQAAQLRKAFNDAMSPLSIVRQDAYFRVAILVDQGLSMGPPISVAALAALAAHSSEVVAAATAALAAPAAVTSPQRDVSEPELVALLTVLQAACLFQPEAQRQSCEAGVIELLLQRLAAASPVLVCTCFDTLMALMNERPEALTLFIQQQGMEQVCEVLRSGGDRVRAHAARFLNLVLTHVAPALARDEGGADDGAAAAAARVQAVLGREAAAMLGRRVDLGDPQAEGKLSQLANALQFFMG